MGILSHRRFRLPVLSRLAWAWTLSATACALAGVFLLVAGDRVNGPARVSLAIGREMETMARPVSPGPATTSVLARREPAAPALRDGAPDEPFFTETEDALDLGGDSEPDLRAPEDLPIEEGDVVITIAGAPLGSGQKALAPLAASLQGPPPPMTAAPDPALLQKSPFGSIPKIAADGRRAARYYALAHDLRGTKKRVALIVGGLGLNQAMTERAIDALPPEVTLAFAPYAKDLEFWTARARRAGHEIMVELPMEGYADAESLGPAALLTSRSAAENQQRLDWALARFSGYFAATNYLGGKFSADREAMAA
ncbi:MAG: divergent polysaccharide deacetylase family protein, partial [Amphiplicatus sp.]